MRETDTHYYFWRGSFSQWSMRGFLDPNGTAFNCAEQYMMWCKACHFGDKVIAGEIMDLDNPREQKKRGRGVKHFDEAEWDKWKFQYVWNGNWLKFTQNKDLKEKLLGTGNKVLVEASPYDKVWGVGLSEDDDRILDPKQWQGENLLGKVLMAVRGSIRTLER